MRLHTVPLLCAAALWCAGCATSTAVVYSTHDLAYAERAYRLARVWGRAFIAADLMPGMPWRPAIAAELCSAERVLVLWSAHAAASVEVRLEIRTAAACLRPMVPVLLDQQPLPAELSDVHAVDWRPRHPNPNP